MAQASYTEEYRVPFGDTDAAGVVFYPNYYRWFDRMTHELFRHIGHPLAAYKPNESAPILAETYCTFLSSVRYDDVVAMTAAVVEVRNRSFRVDHIVSRNSEVVARGYEVRVWVSMDAEGVRSTQLPPSVAAALQGT